MRYFVGTELGVANALQRHFDWSSNSLWYEEIPNARDPSRAMFFLGGKDSIINAEVCTALPPPFMILTLISLSLCFCYILSASVSISNRTASVKVSSSTPKEDTAKHSWQAAKDTNTSWLG